MNTQQPTNRFPEHESFVSCPCHYVVYSLSDPRNGHIYYVGISQNMERRYKQHCKCHGVNLELNLWIQELLREGLTPWLCILEKVAGTKKAQERESYWIQFHIDHHAPLKNISKVGRGTVL